MKKEQVATLKDEELQRLLITDDGKGREIKTLALQQLTLRIQHRANKYWNEETQNERLAQEMLDYGFHQGS